MIIAVNTRLLIKDKLEGIGRFSFEILQRLAKNNPEIQFHFIFDRQFHPEFIFGRNVTPHIIGPPARHPFLYYIWFHIQMPRLLKKIKPDALFSPEGYLPLSKKTTFFTVIHDLNFHHRPNDLPFWERWYYNRFFPKYAKIADHIFTVSKYTKQDLSLSYNIDPSKISVIYNGSEHLKLNHDKIEIIKTPYFLNVGSLHARKNIENTLKAFDLFKEKYQTNHQLIIVGEKLFSSFEIENTFNTLAHKKNVLFTGRVSDKELSQYYKNATSLLFLSYFEGFGIPIIEAFQHNTPVISSNTTCLPEIMGEENIAFHPEDLEGVANEMYRIFSDVHYKNQLIENGQKQLRLFSWEESSLQLMNKIKMICQG